MLSLNVRLLLAASIVLAAFLSLTGLALDKAFTDSSIVAVRERLLTEIYSLLAAADSDDAGSLIMPARHPDARFSTPASGLYAEIFSDGGKIIWRSESMLGVEIPFPVIKVKGEPQFEEIVASNGQEMYTLGLGVMWEVAPFIVKGFTFYVAETKEHFEKERMRFRKSLATWLGAVAVALLLVQAVILRWGLAPLRKVAHEVAEIETGQKKELTSNYPKEIAYLATNMNALIRSSNSQLKRYRNALGDLAHSLKTPLAVLRNLVESDQLPTEARKTLSDQIEGLNKTIEYQLQKAVASGRKVLTAPISVSKVAQKLLNSFMKVYVDKNIDFQMNIDPSVKFIGDEGDLMELLGNLMDNACKWCRRKTKVSVYSSDDKELVIQVEDDGPGIASEECERILKRGVRGDSQVEGHGIGMAVVRNLVEDVYQGKLSIETSELGGAKVIVVLAR